MVVSFFGYILRSETTMVLFFIFLRFFHAFLRTFHSGCSNLQFYQTAQSSLFYTSILAFISSLSVMAIVTGMGLYCILNLIFIYLMTSDDENSFLYCWPFRYLFGKNVYSNPLPISKLGYFFFCFCC